MSCYPKAKTTTLTKRIDGTPCMRDMRSTHVMRRPTRMIAQHTEEQSQFQMVCISSINLSTFKIFRALLKFLRPLYLIVNFNTPIEELSTLNSAYNEKNVEIFLCYMQLFIKGDIFIGEWGIFGAGVFLHYNQFFIKGDFVIGR